MARYVHRETGRVVYARQWRGFNEDTMTGFVRPATYAVDAHKRIVFDGSGLAADVNDWITREPGGDLLRVVPRDTFMLNYERRDDDGPVAAES